MIIYAPTITHNYGKYKYYEYCRKYVCTHKAEVIPVMIPKDILLLCSIHE